MKGRFSLGIEWSGSKTPFSNARRGKLESVVDTIVLVGSVAAEDFVLALERDEFDCPFRFVLPHFQMLLGFSPSGERFLGGGVRR